MSELYIPYSTARDGADLNGSKTYGNGSVPALSRVVAEA